MFLVEGVEGKIVSDRGGGDKGVDDAGAVGEAGSDEGVESLIAGGFGWPENGERGELLLQQLSILFVLTTLAKLKCNKTWQTDRNSHRGKPCKRRRMLAEDIDRNIRIKQDHLVMPTCFGFLAKLTGKIERISDVGTILPQTGEF